MLDTNILVYAFGMDTDASKKARAGRVLEQYHSEGYLATQVLTEFVNVALRHGKDPDWIVCQVQQLSKHWTVLTPTVRTPEVALRALIAHHLSWWDSTIWAIAQENGVSVILSEDGPSGSTVGGIRYVNPLM